jgi:hypothetical protein
MYTVFIFFFGEQYVKRMEGVHFEYMDLQGTEYPCFPVAKLFYRYHHLPFPTVDLCKDVKAKDHPKAKGKERPCPVN